MFGDFNIKNKYQLQVESELTQYVLKRTGHNKVFSDLCFSARSIINVTSNMKNADKLLLPLRRLLVLSK